MVKAPTPDTTPEALFWHEPQKTTGKMNRKSLKRWNFPGQGGQNKFLLTYKCRVAVKFFWFGGEQSIKMWGFHEHIHRTSFTIWLGGHIYNSFLIESKLLKLGMRISSTKIIAVSVTKVSKTHTDSPAHADVPNSTKWSIMSTKAYTTNPLKFFSLIFRIPAE